MPPPIPILETKLAALEQIYALFEAHAAPKPWACQEGCAHCCTCNVTLTTLEGVYLIRSLNPLAADLLDQVQARCRAPRYQPQITLNDFAWRCAHGHPTPEEANDPQWGDCILLDQNLCRHYAARPFACRCMLSTQSCHQQGQASLDEFQLTLNHLFLQTIEHLDCPGKTGNLVDILLYLQYQESREGADQSEENSAALPTNQPARVLMIPPEHRQAAGPILATLQGIIAQAGGGPQAT